MNDGATSKRERLFRWLAIAAYLSLGVSSLLFARSYATLLSPLIESIIPLIYDRLDIYTVDVIRYRNEWGYQLFADNTAALVVGQTTLPPHLGIKAFTLVAHSAQHVLFFSIVIAGSLIFILPDYRKLLLLTPVLLIILELIDIPFVLTGSVEDLLLFQFAPDEHQGSLRVAWMNMMTNGGRMALAMASAWLLVVFSRRQAGSSENRA